MPEALSTCWRRVPGRASAGERSVADRRAAIGAAQSPDELTWEAPSIREIIGE